MNASAHEATAKELEKLLANSYTLYLKTHNFHWNVTGPMFSTLHNLFETQYTELAMAIDEIAERIRSLGFRAPGSFAEFGRLAEVPEASGEPSAQEMVAQLVSDMDIVRESARRVLETAESAQDAVSADLATRRMEVAEKTAWMLSSHNA